MFDDFDCMIVDHRTSSHASMPIILVNKVEKKIEKLVKQQPRGPLVISIKLISSNGNTRRIDRKRISPTTNLVARTWSNFVFSIWEDLNGHQSNYL
jgi:hypothetical protein